LFRQLGDHLSATYVCYLNMPEVSLRTVSYHIRFVEFSYTLH